MLERIYELVTSDAADDYPQLRISTRDLRFRISSLNKSFSKELDCGTDSDSFGKKKHRFQGQLFQIVRIFETFNCLAYLCHLTLMVVKWRGHHSGKGFNPSRLKIRKFSWRLSSWHEICSSLHPTASLASLDKI